ncbi:DUF6884 domain-containing protein [Myxococcus stipitatus]|uniref:DUF6884 domain-containing protein n=1 Tax=Myxococcus stipitatus TaxID=83455 RepID=UPI003CD03153
MSSLPCCSPARPTRCFRCRAPAQVSDTILSDGSLELPSASTARAARLSRLGRPVRLALLSCSKSKRTRASRAHTLYTGPFFRAAFDVAAAFADELVILSARHHIVEPHQVLEPYDYSFADMRKPERVAWRTRCTTLLRHRFHSHAVECLFLGGEDYQLDWHLLPRWTIRSPIDRVVGVGNRIAALRDCVVKLAIKESGA